MDTATYQSCLDILGDSNRQTEERFAAMTQAFPRSVEFGQPEQMLSALCALRDDIQDDATLVSSEDFISLELNIVFLHNQLGHKAETDEAVQRWMQRLRTDDQLSAVLRIHIINTCYHVFYYRGRNQEFEELIPLCISALKEEGLSDKVRSQVCSMLALMFHAVIDQENALYYAQEANKYALRTDAKHLTFFISTTLSSVYLFGGQLTKVRALCDENSSEVPERVAIYSKFHYLVGQVAEGQGDISEHKATLLRWLEEYQEPKAPRFKMSLLVALAWCALIESNAKELSLRLGTLLRESATFDRAYSHQIELLMLMSRLLHGDWIDTEPAHEFLPDVQVGQVAFYQWLHGEPVDVDDSYCHPISRWLVTHLKAQPQPLKVLRGRSNHALGVICFPDGVERDISRRGAMMNLLQVLLCAKTKGRGFVSTNELFEAGWPDVKGFPKNGQRRVYTELHRLKEWGVEISSGRDGYALVNYAVWLQGADL